MMSRQHIGLCPILPLLAALVLAGCGGGGGGNGSGASGNGGNGGSSSLFTNGSSGGTGATSTGGGTTAFTPDQRMASLDAVKNQWAALPGVDPAADLKTMAQFLTARPEFKSVVLLPDGVCARFKDGPLLLLTNDRTPTPDDSGGSARSVPSALFHAGTPATPVSVAALNHVVSSTRASTAVDLPTPQQARVINTFDPLVDPETQTVGTMLSANGYNVITSGGTLEDLKGISGDGVFYLDAHCTQLQDINGQPIAFPDGATHFFLTSNTPATAANIKAYDSEMGTKIGDNGGDRLAYNLVLQTSRVNGTVVSKIVPTGVIAFSDLFIKDNWRFGANSLVILNACRSNSATVKNVCMGAGAGLYGGWTADVDNPVAVKMGKFVVDRLIGANKYMVEPDGPQRPFDYPNVYTNLTQYGLQTDGTAIFLFTPNPASTFGLLAPSISYMGMDEVKKELTINGIFGTEEGTVTVDGTQVAVKSWGFNAIICSLPPNLAGDVIVEVRKHKSNVVQLTEWRAHFITTLTAQGSLQQTGYLDVNFRADVHSHRDKPHTKPVDPIVPFQQEPDSTGQFNASGTATMNGVTVTWKGSSTLLPSQFNQGATNLLFSFGQVDVINKKVDIALEAASTSGMTTTQTPPGSTVTIPGATGMLDGAYAAGQPIPALHLTLNSDFSIPGGVREEKTNSFTTVRLQWNAIVPTAPPDPKAARSVRAR